MPVEPSDRALVTLQEAARYIRDVDIEDEETADTLQELINEASDFIHLDTGREFIWTHGLYESSETRTVPFVFGQHINIGDLREIDAISLNGTALAETDWSLSTAPGYSIYPPRLLALAPTVAATTVAWPSTFYPQDILEIEGTWGFETVPDIIKRACKLIVESWWQRDIQVTSDSYDDEGGGLGFETTTVADRTFVIPLAAEQILSRFRRLAVL
jgi:glutaredoxin